MKLPQFSLRHLFWLVLVVGLALGWWTKRVRLRSWGDSIDRSWHSGTIAVEPYWQGNELGLHVRGEWPDASPDLWLKGSCWLVQDDSPDELVFGVVRQLAQPRSMGVSDYANGPLKRLAHPDQPHRAAFDYEIWRGKPGRGELLTKQSAFLELISPPK